MPAAFVSPAARTPRNLFVDADFHLVNGFFAARPDLRPTPVHHVSALARALGIGDLLVKDETSRFGLDAFKAAGATFAVSTLRSRGEITPGDTLACASEGNHGRAVARAARDNDCGAKVYMSQTVSPARVSAIEGEGAEVVLIEGTYDDAVRAVVDDAAAHGWVLVSDTSHPGYAEIPRLIMLGYTHILDESPFPTPDIICIPGGVGGLLAAVACWCDWKYRAARPRIVAVEPLTAACLQASARMGRPTPVAGPFATTMGGLRCGEVSAEAFPAIESLVDAFVAIEDEFAFDAMRRLAAPTADDPRIACGPSGAAALGGLLALLTVDGLGPIRESLGLGRQSRVMVIASEGVTDPALFASVLARP